MTNDWEYCDKVHEYFLPYWHEQFVSFFTIGKDYFAQTYLRSCPYISLERQILVGNYVIIGKVLVVLLCF
jgi:hypothetical protein